MLIGGDSRNCWQPGFTDGTAFYLLHVVSGKKEGCLAHLGLFRRRPLVFLYSKEQSLAGRGLGFYPRVAVLCTEHICCAGRKGPLRDCHSCFDLACEQTLCNEFFSALPRFAGMGHVANGVEPTGRARGRNGSLLPLLLVDSYVSAPHADFWYECILSRCIPLPIPSLPALLPGGHLPFSLLPLVSIFFVAIAEHCEGARLVSGLYTQCILFFLDFIPQSRCHRASAY